MAFKKKEVVQEPAEQAVEPTPVFERQVMDSPTSTIVSEAPTPIKISTSEKVEVNRVELYRLMFALLTARTNHITRMSAMRVAHNLTGFEGAELQAFMDAAKQQCIGTIGV